MGTVCASHRHIICTNVQQMLQLKDGKADEQLSALLDRLASRQVVLWRLKL